MTRRGKSGSLNFWYVGALFAAFLVSGAAFGQDDAADASDADSSEIERIAITGSRIKRTDIEGPAPVLVIDQEQLNANGYTTVYEALADLTINNGFKFEGPETTNGFSPDVQTLNLRGFGVGETLVPLIPPTMPCVLVNPCVPVATMDVFKALGLRHGELLVGVTDVMMPGPSWPEEGGSLLELSDGGKRTIALPGGEARSFLEDGDTVILRAFAVAANARRVGFGEARATVLPSR